MKDHGKRRVGVASPRRRVLVKAGAALGGFAAGMPLLATGQSSAAAPPGVAPGWPSRAVRVVVPFGPAGTADILGRIIAQQLALQLAQPFVVENRPGAGTTIGAAEVAKSPADGYTMMVVTPSFAIAQYVYPNLPYDGPKDFIPVALLMTTPLMLVVNPKTGFRTTRDFINAAKASPGRISFASAGSGSTPHLAFELFKIQAGVDLLHVPYKGGGEAVTSVLSGTTDAYFSAPIESGPHVRAGTMVALGASSLKRTPGLPDLPTIAETDLPGFEVTHYTSVLVRSGTPPDIVAKLSDNIVRAIQAPDVRDKVAQNGDVPQGTRAEAADLYAREYERWARAVKVANVKP